MLEVVTERMSSLKLSREARERGSEFFDLSQLTPLFLVKLLRSKFDLKLPGPSQSLPIDAWVKRLDSPPVQPSLEPTSDRYAARLPLCASSAGAPTLASLNSSLSLSFSIRHGVFLYGQERESLRWILKSLPCYRQRQIRRHVTYRLGASVILLGGNGECNETAFIPSPLPR